MVTPHKGLGKRTAPAPVCANKRRRLVCCRVLQPGSSVSFYVTCFCSVSPAVHQMQMQQGTTDRRGRLHVTHAGSMCVEHVCADAEGVGTAMHVTVTVGSGARLLVTV